MSGYWGSKTEKVHAQLQHSLQILPMDREEAANLSAAG
jgi:hypothetical protein